MGASKGYFRGPRIPENLFPVKMNDNTCYKRNARKVKQGENFVFVDLVQCLFMNLKSKRIWFHCDNSKINISSSKLQMLPVHDGWNFFLIGRKNKNQTEGTLMSRSGEHTGTDYAAVTRREVVSDYCERTAPEHCTFTVPTMPPSTKLAHLHYALARTHLIPSYRLITQM